MHKKNDKIKRNKKTWGAIYVVFFKQKPKTKTTKKNTTKTYQKNTNKKLELTKTKQKHTNKQKYL